MRQLGKSTVASLPSAMETEFNQFAWWTAEALSRRSPDEALAAACRGSGNPAAMSWLAEWMRLAPTSRVLDIGGGIGGPAAWLRRHSKTTPVVVEPMPGAAGGVRLLWDLPVAVAWADRLPFPANTFDGAWALGVIDTTPAKAELLAEARRVIRPEGRLGLLAYLRGPDQLSSDATPEGNSFGTASELADLLVDNGWIVDAHLRAARLPPAPVSWKRSARDVKADVAAAHPNDAAIADVNRQEEKITALIRSDLVIPHLLVVKGG